MKEDWAGFDRRMGHGRVEILIPITGVKKIWSRLMAGFGKKPARNALACEAGGEVPVYQPDDIDRAIDQAFEQMTKSTVTNQQSSIQGGG